MLLLLLLLLLLLVVVVVVVVVALLPMMLLTTVVVMMMLVMLVLLSTKKLASSSTAAEFKGKVCVPTTPTASEKVPKGESTATAHHHPPNMIPRPTTCPSKRRKHSMLGMDLQGESTKTATTATTALLLLLLQPFLSELIVHTPLLWISQHLIR